MSNLDNPLNHSLLQDDAPGVDISKAVGVIGSSETGHVYNSLVIYTSN